MTPEQERELRLFIILDSFVSNMFSYLRDNPEGRKQFINNMTDSIPKESLEQYANTYFNRF